MATTTTESSMKDPNGGERLQEAASGLIDQAGRTAETQASRTMTRAGETLDQVARAVRDAGSGMRTERPEIAEFAETAAGRVEEAAEYLRVHDASELVDEATRFARQQPVLVVGGALLAGLAIGRLLKSSTSMQSGARAGMYGQTGYGRTSYGGSTYESRAGMGYGRTGTGYGAAGSDLDASATSYGAAGNDLDASATSYGGSTRSTTPSGSGSRTQSNSRTSGSRSTSSTQASKSSGSESKGA
jgi:ElaB/YqjD/DUF883 family membrane-anchored ribosome-binding protein